MLLKWIVMAAILFKLTIESVNADIECHYCGMRDTCTLPYVETWASKINCTHSCMKFDGINGAGKRVVVRSCGKKNLTICKINENWNGGIGELCFCNKQQCNLASKIEKINIMISFLSMFTLMIAN